MVSSAERLARNLDFSMITRAKELKSRFVFVVLALIVYRIGTYIPLPSINPNALKEIFAQQNEGILGVFNMFSGGALGRMTVFALAIMPYITSSIIIQLLSVAVPQLAALKKEGESGRRKINQYTRYATYILALVQGYGVAISLESSYPISSGVVSDPGVFFRITTMVTLAGGTMFLMWLGEQMTSRGIGNGISLIIFVGIVAELPSGFLSLGSINIHPVAVLFILLSALALIFLIVFFERAQRRIIVQYPKRQVGNKLYAGDTTHLPLKLNTAGVIPPIFASSLLLLPLTLTNFNSASTPSWLLDIASYLGHGQPAYILAYTAIIIFFCFFYTAVVFNSEETAENLKKNGGFIAGIRPGKPTAVYLDYILTRITVLGSIYLAVVCVLPEIIIAKYSIPFFLGGTSLLIIVNVSIEFVGQVQSHLFAHQYEHLIKKSRIQGRK
ncbi:MAG: preprotein translocase subunit SecY [Alphaproteobacteria bacterium]|nr:MAG: preprotein translocase subunit SecY [Alphaproteobacteria bacterium]TAF13235.1 MAG: preprotein translocase subunit SecY [Alphaproteobacteria bacterium]TAF40913.1 MAG: preprotein translocase subunit SecY [Alphaproteobacteria bacterium]TAF76869.1 MAG: preprotein translocase subunit SecY [Alphaproteobacteria bacterium]